MATKASATKAASENGEDPKPVSAINVQRIGSQTLKIPLIGTAPLIVHNWSTKAKQQMLDAQQGRRKVKENRDPEADYLASLYRIASEDGEPERTGFPVLGFKAATIGAARFYGKDVTMTMLKQCMFFTGIHTEADNQQLVEIHGDHRMREDVVRLGQGSTDLRFRAEYPEWRAELIVTFVTSALNESSLLSLIDAGGLGVGVGEWRPQRGGEFGTYTLDQDRPIEQVKDIAALGLR